MAEANTSFSTSMDTLVKRAAFATVIAGLLAVVVGGLLKGVPGVIGAAIGAAIVVIFFTIGQLVLGAVIKKNPSMAMSVAMLMYLVKVAVLFSLMLAFKNTSAFDTKVFASSILLCTLVWTGAEMWAFGTAKVLYVDPNSKPEIVPPVTENDKTF